MTSDERPRRSTADVLADCDDILDNWQGSSDAMRWIPEEARDEPAPAEERPLPGMEDQPPARPHWLRERYLARRADGTETATRRVVDDYVRGLYSGGPPPIGTPSNLIRWEDIRRMWDALPDSPRPVDRGRWDPPSDDPAARIFTEGRSAEALAFLPLARHGLGRIVVVASTGRRFGGWCNEHNLPQADRGRHVLHVTDPYRLHGLIVIAAVVLDDCGGPRAYEAMATIRSRMRPLDPAEVRRAADAAVQEIVERHRQETEARLPAGCVRCLSYGQPCAYHRGPEWWIGGRQVSGIRGVSFSRAIVDETVMFPAGGRANGRTSALREAVRAVPHAWVGRDGTVTYPLATPPDNVITIAGHCWCGSKVDHIQRIGHDTDFPRTRDDWARVPLPTEFRLYPCQHQIGRFRVETAEDGRLLGWFHPRPWSCQ